MLAYKLFTCGAVSSALAPGFYNACCFCPLVKNEWVLQTHTFRLVDVLCYLLVAGEQPGYGFVCLKSHLC